MTTSARLLNNPEARIGLKIGILLDVLGELRGEWSGRYLNAEQRQVLTNVFGGDIRLDEIKVVYNAFTVQDISGNGAQGTEARPVSLEAGGQESFGVGAANVSVELTGRISGIRNAGDDMKGAIRNAEKVADRAIDAAYDAYKSAKKSIESWENAREKALRAATDRAVRALPRWARSPEPLPRL